MYSTIIENGHDQDVLELKRQWQLFDPQTRPQSLWITSTDHGMNRVIERIMDAEPTLFLRRPFNRLSGYAPSQSNPTSAVDYAVDDLGVTDITVCGHSVYDGIRAMPTSAPPTSRRNGTSSHNGFPGLLQRVSERQSLFAQARQNVIDQLAIVAAYPSVARGLQEGRISLFGLLLTDSGIFLVYDDSTGEFVAIGPPIHTAM